MADKVWSQEQREAAAEVLTTRQEAATQLFYSIGGYGYEVWAIELQCELTSKDAELAEAVELLSWHDEYSPKPRYRGRLRVMQTEWLKRNTPQEGEAK